MSRAGRWMMTSNGRCYWPTDPRSQEVSIVAIAHHLAMQCRWAGATTRFYSVAQHSVHASHLVPDEFALEALMHDSPEYVVQDMIRPLKYDPRFREPYHEIEDLNARVIAKQFGLTYPWPEIVKHADEALARAEWDQLIYKAEPIELDYVDQSPLSWTQPFPDWDWKQARVEFLNRFEAVYTKHLDRLAA